MGDAAIGGNALQDLKYWIWLSQLSISPKARAAVLHAFQTAEHAFFSKEGSFRSCRGISAREAELLEMRELSGVDAVLEACDRQGLRILSYPDPDYPEKLRQIYMSPVCLYIRGVLPPLDDHPVVSVIGTRKASPYGVKMGELFSAQIACGGGTVVSLLGSGVDESAARGALLSGHPCVGVLGTPHETCRIPISEDVVLNGVLISEYPPGMECSRRFFRERNRIAAGISDGVLVIEAPEKSGTRLFVEDAVEQGKDIFAIPGNVDSDNAVGTHRLIKEGAKLVTCGREVLEEYLSRYPGTVDLEAADCFSGRVKEQRQPDERMTSESDENADDLSAEITERNGNAGPSKPALIETSGAQLSNPQKLHEQLAVLTEDQLRIIAAIDSSTTHVDDIVERSGLSVARVLAQLTVLEIKGYVHRETGRRFSLIIRTEK